MTTYYAAITPDRTDVTIRQTESRTYKFAAWVGSAAEGVRIVSFHGRQELAMASGQDLMKRTAKSEDPVTEHGAVPTIEITREQFRAAQKAETKQEAIAAVGTADEDKPEPEARKTPAQTKEKTVDKQHKLSKPMQKTLIEARDGWVRPHDGMITKGLRLRDLIEGDREEFGYRLTDLGCEVAEQLGAPEQFESE